VERLYNCCMRMCSAFVRIFFVIKLNLNLKFKTCCGRFCLVVVSSQVEPLLKDVHVYTHMLA
jgi:hypothetical protein